MAEREELILEIRTELDRAESEVDSLQRQLRELEGGMDDVGAAGEKAGADASSGLEKVGMSAQDAAKLVVALAQDTDKSARDAKAAADALAKALGPELTAKVDLDKVVQGFKDLGVSMDTVRQDADTLATALKQVDQINVDALNDGIDLSTQKMRGLGHESDQSRSVLANLAGNAAQDLGELGGVAGTAGVAIGQLAEYAVDGHIELGKLAKFAGPMLGVAAAATLISTAVGGIKAEQAFRSELVDNFTDSLRDAETVAQSIRDTIAETGSLDVSLPGGLANLGRETENLIPVLNTFGLTFTDFMRLVQLQLDGNTEALDEFYAQLNAGHNPFGDYQEGVGALAAGVDQYADAALAAEDAQQAFNNVMAGSANTIDEANAAFTSFSQQQKLVDGLWNVVTQDLARNQELTKNGTYAWNQLQAILGLTNEQMAEMADERLQELADKLNVAKISTRDAASAMAGMRQEVDDASSSLAEAAAHLDLASIRGDAFATALGNIAENSELTQAGELISFADGLTKIHDAVEALVDSDVGLTNLDLVPDSWSDVMNMPEELRPVVEALSQFKPILDNEFAQAFEEGGSTRAILWAGNTRRAIVDQLHAAGIDSEDQINQILSALGLLPEQVTTTVRIANGEEARTVLDEISSALDLLPPEVQTQIALIAPTDPVGALQLAINALIGAGVPVPVDLQLLPGQLGGKTFGDVFGVPAPALTITPELDSSVAVAALNHITDAEYTAEITTSTPSLPVTRFAIQSVANAEYQATVDTDADTKEATTQIDEVVTGDYNTTVHTDADVSVASSKLSALVAQQRTAAIDAILRSAPTSSQITSQVTNGRGYIPIPLVGVWSTRIEGSRPR